MHLPEQYTDMHGGALTESADIEWQALLSGTNELARYLLEEYGIKLVFHPHADTHVDTMNVAASKTLARSRCARLIRPSTATTITEVRAVSKDRDALRGHGSPIATKSPSSCCGSWPAGCAAPTATWTPLVVGAARVSFVRAAPGPGVIPPGGSGEGRATDVVHHPRRWPRTISFADGGHQRLVDVRGPSR